MGTEKIRGKLKMFKTCLIPAILHGIEAWGRILTKEIDEMEERKAKHSNNYCNNQISASTAGVLIEAGAWPAKEYLQCRKMMLYHSTINSEEEPIAKNIVKEQPKYNLEQTF